MSYAVLSHVNWNDVQGQFFSTEVEATDYFSTLKRSKLFTSHMQINSLGKELNYWGVRNGRDKEMRDWWGQHIAPYLDLKLEITNTEGKSWLFSADRNWSVQDTKIRIEELYEVPANQQRLTYKDVFLSNFKKLREVGGGDAASLHFSLSRRHPEQAVWMDKVKADPSKLAEAPPDIRAEAEIVMLAASKDCNLQLLAAPSLFADADYVYDAIRQRGGPEASELSSLSLGWVQTAADAKLALRAAFHLRSVDLATAVFGLKAFKKASEEHRPHLVAEPFITPEAARELMGGSPNEVICMALQQSTLDNLKVGLWLLDEQAKAPAAAWTFFGGGKSKTPILEGELLEPREYALELFARHVEHLQSTDGSEQFDSLLEHLKGIVPPRRYFCCLLVRTCLRQAKKEEAERFFLRGADDSDECASLLTEALLPMTVLHKHELRDKLLARVLASYGGPAEVLDAVRQNRGSIRTLIQRAEGDAAVGRSQGLCDALQFAVQENEEAAGRILLRAFAAPSPQMLPDLPIPMPWLQELRDLAGCDSFVIDKLLETLQATTDKEVASLMYTSWMVADWNLSTPAQMSRALDEVNRVGIQNRLALAEIGGREGEQKRLEAEGQLIQALEALPLARLQDPTVLCRPGMPAHAVSMAAFRYAQQAENQAQQAKNRAQEAEERARQAEAYNDKLKEALETVRYEGRQDNSMLQSKVDELQSEVKSLETMVSSVRKTKSSPS